MAKLLMDMTDNELLTSYRQVSERVQYSPRDHELETDRRANNQKARWMFWMTVASTTTSIVAVMISLMKK